MAKLKAKHASRPFNPDVANAFFRAGMIEARGCGIELILEACRTAEIPEPDLRYESDGLWVNFRFPEALRGSTAQEGLGETRVTIVRAMLADPKATTAQLARALKISSTAVEKHLRHLRRQGHIERVGPAKGGHWRVKAVQS